MERDRERERERERGRERGLIVEPCEDQGIPVDLEDDGVDDDDELNRNDNLDRDGQQIRQMLIKERF